MRSVRRDIIPSILDKLGSNLSEPSLIISGFWRSGTSVLLKALCSGCAKSVFEPFTWALHNSPTRPNRCAYPVSLNSYPFSEKLVASIFNSSLGGSWVRKERVSWLDSLRSRVVVKDVRIHFLLDEFISAYEIPVLQIVRDPRAVYLSLCNWKYGKSYRNPDLAPLILCLKYSHSPIYGLSCELVEHVSSPAERFALAWCSLLAHNYFRLSAHPLLLFLQYEDLILNPKPNLASLAKLCPWIKAEKTFRVLADEHSSVTIPSRQQASPYSRCFSWENGLSHQDQSAIVSMVSRFGLLQFLREPADISSALM